MKIGIAHPLRFGPRGPLLVGVVGLVVLVVAGFFAPGVALRGWLIGFVTAGAVPLGCCCCLAIHALTGGNWGRKGRLPLLTGALTLPVLLVMLVPLLVASPFLYPWAADPSTAGSGVARIYLNPVSVGIRSLVLLGAMWIFGVACRRGPVGMLMAGVFLTFDVVLMNLSAFDWILSLDPRYTSSAFGVQIIVEQIIAALCFVILTADAAPDDQAWGDWGALLLACVLGETYLIYMTFLIQWYGDLPDQAHWFLQRTLHGWRWLEVAGSVLGSFGPMLALLFTRVRHDPSRLRLVAVFVLFGIVAENLWLVAPGTGAGLDGWSALAGLIGCATVAGLLLTFVTRWAASRPRNAGPTHLGMADGI